jgi:hypothetical protein
MNPHGQQLVHLVLTLASKGDLDRLPNVVAGERLLLAKELGALVESFDYVNSVAFGEITGGKSPTVVNAWRRKVSDPVKRTELREEFYGQVRSILQGGQVEKYLPPEAKSRVARIRNELEALNAI